jgi:inorganic pyrophosphatase
MNYLHAINSGSDDAMNVIVEIPRDSNNKYEIDKETGMIALDRAMHTAQSYPFDYGFIPQTRWDDGDALDVVLLTTYSLDPGILVRTRPVGIMTMIDGGESDDKLIGVPVDDPRWDDVADIDDVHDHTIKEIEHFFRTYKDLQDNAIQIEGFDGEDEAKAAFKRARQLYEQTFSDTQ